MSRFAAAILILILTLGVPGGAKAELEDELLSAWDISPTLCGYEIAPLIKERFNLDFVYKKDGSHRLDGDIKLDMYGYNADIKIYWLSPGYTIIFDDWCVANENNRLVLIDKASKRFEDVLSGFIGKYGNPEWVMIRYRRGIESVDYEKIPYVDGFDVKNYFEMKKDSDRINIQVVKDNVAISMENWREFDYKNSAWNLDSSLGIEYNAEPVNVPEPKPSVEPTPIPTNVPTGF